MPSEGALTLAQLIKDGYFSIILTTNFDNLIEKSLQDVGVSTDDYQVLINEPGNPLKELNRLISYEKPRIKIVKLHGDIYSRKYAITNEETIEFDTPLRQQLEELFRLNDLILIGIKFADLDLLKAMPNEGGSIWYVSPSEPESYIESMMRVRGSECNVISGESGKFDNFVSGVSNHVTTSESKDFNIDWYIFLPFCIDGLNTGEIEALKSSNKEPKDNYIEFSGFTSLDCDCVLNWYEYGVAVWVIKKNATYNNIYEYALDRKRTYAKFLQGEHPITQLTLNILSEPKGKNIDKMPVLTSSIGYAFSIVNVVNHGWKGPYKDNAIKLLSCPSLLDDRYISHESEWVSDQRVPTPELHTKLRKSEFELIREGKFRGGFSPFSIAQVLTGYACWAGVAFHIQDKDRSIPLSELIAYESALQSCWWYLHHAKSKIEEHDDKKVCEHYATSGVKRQMSRLLSIGPTEGTLSRTYKEAIIETSRIERLWQDFKDIL